MEGSWTDLSAFHFIRPWWLLGLLFIIVPWFKSRRKRPRALIDQLVDKHLQSVVVDVPEYQSENKMRFLPQLIIGLFCIALAGPAWQRLPQSLYQLQQGRVLLLSLSETMDNKDILPSRLKRAKFKLADLMESMPSVLTGLIGFAGEAFVVAPLSDDRQTVLNLLNALDTKTLPVQGIHAEKGLQKAADLLSQVGLDSGEVVLIADQVSPLAVEQAARLREREMRVSVLSLAPIANAAQQSLLKSIAKSGGGTYTALTADDRDIKRLNLPLNNFLLRAQSTPDQSQRSADQWRDVGPYLLLPIVLLSSLLFRRGWFISAYAALLPCLFLFSSPNQAIAFETENLWQRSDQTQWRAAQAYRAQDYQTALDGFKKDMSADGLYNQANALARLGSLDEAVVAYDRALAIKPDFENALFNRDLVQAELDKKNETEQKQQAEQDKNADQSRQEQNEDGENKGETKDGEGESDRNEKEGTTQTEREGQEEIESGRAQEGDSSSSPLDEDEQTLQMMMRQVPDDPGALLRRKFARQYSQMRGKKGYDEQ